MLPYLEYHAIILGPVTLQVWGLWVSLGVIAGVLLADRLAKKNFLAPQLVWDLAVWALLAGLLGARVGHVLFYDPSYYISGKAGHHRSAGLSVPVWPWGLLPKSEKFLSPNYPPI